MATKTLPVCFALNNAGVRADPDSADVMLINPNLTTHTAWATASPGKITDVGVGSLSHNFTINDATDVAGMYHAFCKATFGSDVVLVVIQVEVSL